MYICVIIYKLIIQNKEIIVQSQYIYSLIVNVSIYLFKLD